MYNYFTSNNQITNNQSGFRPNDSATNQLICLADSIHSSSDINLDVRSVFPDMSKAFVTECGMKDCFLNLNKMELMANYSTFLKVIWQIGINESFLVVLNLDGG